ncbi:hypothetical protein [Stakelama tenebrarum]|uniref:Uncharacterized protein n=1 Tax=Stakelama tenebrarum TaxID=2711215 RepID=A0A6G6Y5U1_9SPHN|nr:hypothetical protein [Sphingosinithalassobacter tenebrarum]QIG79946.1 hypothetical protein G5C33_09260 [Sphingosinithalassobacter tenebrarum]
MEEDLFKSAREYLIEEREQDFNTLIVGIERFAQNIMREGTDVPAVICALLYVARHLHRKHEDVVGEDFFERCVEDILNGGTGLHNHTPFSD